MSFGQMLFGQKTWPPHVIQTYWKRINTGDLQTRLNWLHWVVYYRRHDTQYDNTQYNNKKYSIMALSVAFFIVMLSVSG